MCGRYFIDDDTMREVEKLVSETERRLGNTCRAKAVYASGDVYPSNAAAVMTGGALGLCLEGMRWGYPKYRGTGLLVNARAETALERRMFRESVLHRRCVVPAKWFYEWDSDKNKALFMRKEQPVLYMAGIYHRFQDGDHFVILTTQANASVSPVHHRMPLVLEEHELESWVFPKINGLEYGECLTNQGYGDLEGFLKSVLNKIPPMLSREQEYEQQCLVF